MILILVIPVPGFPFYPGENKVQSAPTREGGKMDPSDDF